VPGSVALCLKSSATMPPGGGDAAPLAAQPVAIGAAVNDHGAHRGVLGGVQDKAEPGYRWFLMPFARYAEEQGIPALRRRFVRQPPPSSCLEKAVQEARQTC